MCNEQTNKMKMLVIILTMRAKQSKSYRCEECVCVIHRCGNQAPTLEVGATKQTMSNKIKQKESIFYVDKHTHT